MRHSFEDKLRHSWYSGLARRQSISHVVALLAKEIVELTVNDRIHFESYRRDVSCEERRASTTSLLFSPSSSRRCSILSYPSVAPLSTTAKQKGSTKPPGKHSTSAYANISQSTTTTNSSSSSKQQIDNLLVHFSTDDNSNKVVVTKIELLETKTTSLHE